MSDLSHKLDMQAFRALGVLRSLHENGKLAHVPPSTLATCEEIFAEYDKELAALNIGPALVLKADVGRTIAAAEKSEP